MQIQILHSKLEFMKKIFFKLSIAFLSIILFNIKSYSQCSMQLAKPIGKIKNYFEKCYALKNVDYKKTLVLQIKRSYSYDEIGNLIMKNEFGTSADSNTILSTKFYSYKDGFLDKEYDTGIKMTMNGLTGSTSYNKYFIYDKSKNLIVDSSFSDFGLNITNYKYNTKNQRIEVNNVTNEYQDVHKYKYDKFGNISEDSYQVLPSTDITRYFNKYDLRKNKIEAHAYNNDVYANFQRFKYDKNNNMIEESAYFSNGMLTWKRFYKIKYDKLNNWTSISSFSDGKFEVISVREIEYY